MAVNVTKNTLNFDNKLKDCSSRRATEDHVTICKTRGYKAKLGLGFFNLLLIVGVSSGLFRGHLEKAMKKLYLQISITKVIGMYFNFQISCMIVF